MPSGKRALLALVLLAAPSAAADPPFATELAIAFGYEGGSTDRPLVVIDGAPSPAYAYSADDRGHTVDVSATRWLAPVADDGRTPLALLPYVSRAPSVTARFALTGASRDSLGRYSGQDSTYEVSVAGDGSRSEAELSGEWFAGDLALRGGFAYANERDTDASTSVESPSGRADVGTAGTRSSTSTGSLGLALRLGDHELSATGSYGATSLTRDDASAFTGSAQPFLSTLRYDGLTREATLAARLLLFGRRLAVDASGAYALTTSSSDVTTNLAGPYSQGRVTSRTAAVEATWFATRRLGLTAGFGYGTRSTASGSPGRIAPSRSEVERVFSVGARWFASERASVVVSASRTENDAVAPPSGATFQRFEETTDRATLGAALRF